MNISQNQVILAGVDYSGIPGAELTRVIIGPRPEVDPDTAWITIPPSDWQS